MALPLVYYAATSLAPVFGAAAMRFTPQLMRSVSVLSNSVRSVSVQVGNQLGNSGRLAGDFSRGASQFVTTKLNSISNGIAGFDRTVETMSDTVQHTKNNLFSLRPF